jgi:hypothetical protein
MFLVSLNPEECELVMGETMMYANNEGGVKIITQKLAQRNPNSTLFVYKLTKKVTVKATFQYQAYVYNEKGELLPE